MRILILGGNRFFGKKLARNLANQGHELTLLNRGNIDDGLGDQVQRLKCDRRNEADLKKVLGNKKWDLVYDQVCYDANEAEMATRVFKDRTEHYIFTSSQSVYLPAANIKEETFDPYEHKFSNTASSANEYAEAKRQCETVFFQKATIPVTAVRFPMVLGSDDYTDRLKFHVERVQDGTPIYFPNLQARLSLISSDDAAATLEFIGLQKTAGPINAASESPISLIDFLSTVENAVNRPANLAAHHAKGNHSPYGIKSDWFMNVSRLTSLGFTPRPIQEWLRHEVERIIGS